MDRFTKFLLCLFAFHLGVKKQVVPLMVSETMKVRKSLVTYVAGVGGFPSILHQNPRLQGALCDVVGGPVTVFFTEKAGKDYGNVFAVRMDMPL